ncbi:hypothetical protein LXL04_010694 [Taraxacum kok-saghyz]
MDLTGNVDAFVEVILGNCKGITKISKTSTPEWNTVFAFSKETIQTSVLEVVVKDKDMMKDDIIGIVRVNLQDIRTQVPPDNPLAPEWYLLEDKRGSKMRCKLMFTVWIRTEADEALPGAFLLNGDGLMARFVQPTRAQKSIILQHFETKVVQARNAKALWNEVMMFVAAEPFEDHLVLSIQDRVGPGEEKLFGRIIIPLNAMEKRLDDRVVNSRWFNLQKPHELEIDEKKKEKDKFATRVHLRVCLEGGYHVLDESTQCSSDLRPTAKQLWKPSIGILELGILNASDLQLMKLCGGKPSTNAFCVAKYGQKWVRTRTVVDSLAPRFTEQYTWEVYDPSTVLTMGVFENGDMTNDRRIGKVRVRISTLESGRVYTHSYPLLGLHPSGVKKMGELHLAIRFSTTSMFDMMMMYSKPLLPKMHYVRPLKVEELETLRAQAIEVVATRLSRAEPPLRREIVEYMTDLDSKSWSMRRTKQNIFRLMAVFNGVVAVSKWFREVCLWKNPITTILVHILFVVPVSFPKLILPTVFLYMFLIGVWNYRFRVPHINPRLPSTDGVDPNDLDEEFDTVPSSRSSEVVRYRYDRLRSVAGKIQSVLVIVSGFYVMRHPRFRHRLSSAPLNFFRRLPTRTDVDEPPRLFSTPPSCSRRELLQSTNHLRVLCSTIGPPTSSIAASIAPVQRLFRTTAPILDASFLLDASILFNASFLLPPISQVRVKPAAEPRHSLQMLKKQTVFLPQTADVWATSSSAELCRCGPQTADVLTLKKQTEPLFMSIDSHSICSSNRSNPPKLGSSSQQVEYCIKKTNPVLGGEQVIGGRVVSARQASTYDQVERMQFLFVHVVKAQNLPSMDITGKLDPFVEVGVGNYKEITRFSETSNPEWNAVFAFSKESMQATVLDVVVKDNHMIEDDCFGIIHVNIHDIPIRVPSDSPIAPEWYRLEDKKGNKVRGELMIAMWIGIQADEAFPHSARSNADSSVRSQVYHSPTLWYIRVNVIEVQDLVWAEETRIPKVCVKAQINNQVSRTKSVQPRTANALWNEDLMFVAAERFEDHLVLTIEDRVGPGQDEVLGRIFIPLSSVEKRVDDRIVHSRWVNLQDPDEYVSDVEEMKKDKFATRLHLRVSLDGGYHVHDESPQYSSDLRPAAKELWKPSVGILEVGILNASILQPMKTREGKGTADAYCVVKYGHQWVRTRTVVGNLSPLFNEQFTWEVYDPSTVVIVGVFDNGQIENENSRDAGIGKIQVRISTLETGRVYTHSYPLLVLHPTGVKKMAELSLAIRFSSTSMINMMMMYSKPLLQKMHYARPLTLVQIEMLRHRAVGIVAARLSRVEPPLRREIVEYITDADSNPWSMRRSKDKFFRVVSVFNGAYSETSKEKAIRKGINECISDPKDP